MRIGAEHGVLVVFLAVLLEQLGIPLPAYPILLLSGSLAAHGDLPWPDLLAAAVAASVIADNVWYVTGRRYGRRVLGLLCRVSLTPDSCVRQTEATFVRRGAVSLLVAKFVPGFAVLATVLAGTMRISRLSFVIYDTLGAALWAGAGLALGTLFSSVIEDVLRVLEQFGRWGVFFLAMALGLFLLRKWWQRRSFSRRLQVERMSVGELTAAQGTGEPMLIVDARPSAVWPEERIPSAISLDESTSLLALRDHPRDALIVVYCACPNDASAIVVAEKLREDGYSRVRPLAGGIDAWLAAGLSVERSSTRQRPDAPGDTPFQMI
jgi:membrane protein DedA with SNARE-associated domain/rhodanese-related sulfurtransferase